MNGNIDRRPRSGIARMNKQKKPMRHAHQLDQVEIKLAPDSAIFMSCTLEYFPIIHLFLIPTTYMYIRSHC